MKNLTMIFGISLIVVSYILTGYSIMHAFLNSFKTSIYYYASSWALLFSGSAITGKSFLKKIRGILKW